MNIIDNLQFVSDHLCTVWSQDIDTEIDEETWKAVLDWVRTSSLLHGISSFSARWYIGRIVQRAGWLAETHPLTLSVTGVILVQPLYSI